MFGMGTGYLNFLSVPADIMIIPYPRAGDKRYFSVKGVIKIVCDIHGIQAVKESEQLFLKP